MKGDWASMWMRYYIGAPIIVLRCPISWTACSFKGAPLQPSTSVMSASQSQLCGADTTEVECSYSNLDITTTGASLSDMLVFILHKSQKKTTA